MKTTTLKVQVGGNKFGVNAGRVTIYIIENPGHIHLEVKGQKYLTEGGGGLD